MATESDRTIAVYQILKSQSDKEHPISMPDLLSLLEERKIPCARRAVYASINALIEQGCKIVYQRKNPQGYYLEHLFTCSELTILTDAIEQSVSLSKEESLLLREKLIQEVSIYEQAKIPLPSMPSNKPKQGNVVNQIDLLLEAIASHRSVSFTYFDLNVKKEKVYRRDGQAYVLDPYAIVSSNNRFYCVFYSTKHQNFANYRIDKMDDLKLDQEISNPVYFDLEQWRSSSFLMYAGQTTTVTGEFALSLLPVVMDQFGEDIILSAIDDKTFEASIKTSLSPTFLAWLMQFYDRIVIKKPQTLVDELLKMAETIQHTYTR